MITNSDCTVYHRIRNHSESKDTWERQYVPKCWWFETTKAAITTSGLKAADVVTVRIPDLSIRAKKGDYIVQGNCPVEMETVKDLSGIEHFAVTGANYNRFGDEPHIKVVGT